MQRKRYKKQHPVPEMFELPGNRENPNSDAIRKSQKRAKSTRRMLKVIVWGVLPATFIVGASIFANANQEIPMASSVEVNDSEGKAAATLGVQRWLGAEVSPIPDGVIVGWDGFETREFIPDPGQELGIPTYFEEIHRFTVTDGVQVFDTRVVVAVDHIAGARVLGEPSLIPRMPEPESTGTEHLWLGWKSGVLSESVETAVDSWIEKMVSGSPRQLKQVVADQRDNVSYLPFSGVREASAKVIGTGIPDEPNVKANTASEVIARVEVQIQWNGQPKLEQGQRPAVIMFDVLIADANTASARVVSWGGVGEGPNLSPYSSGFVDVKFPEPQNVTVDDVDESGIDTADSDEEDSKEGDK